MKQTNNRTTLELKLRIQNFHKRGFMLTIAPHWN